MYLSALLKEENRELAVYWEAKYDVSFCFLPLLFSFNKEQMKEFLNMGNEKTLIKIALEENTSTSRKSKTSWGDSK